MTAEPRDFLDQTVLKETWCPVRTPFWLYEVADFTCLRALQTFERLGLFLLGSDADDPSSRTEHLSFWSVFRLRAHEVLGADALRRMVEDDTLVLWEDHVEACINQYFVGHISVGAAVKIMMTCSPEPTLVPREDWTALCGAFLSSAIWASECLARHRELCRKCEFQDVRCP